MSTLSTLIDAESKNAIATYVKALSKPNQICFLRLYINPVFKTTPPKPFSGIVKTNMFELGAPEPGVAIFPLLPRVNHDCVPNCHLHWNPRSQHMTLHILRDIQEDEEFTISYLQMIGSYDSRQGKTRSLGFEYKCRLCTQPEDTRIILDKMFKLFRCYWDWSEDSERVDQYLGECLSDMRDSITILDATGINADFEKSRKYLKAFEISIGLGDEARASVFAEKALEGHIIAMGHDTSEVEDLKTWVKDPKIHSRFNGGKAWKQRMEDISEGLDEAEFEAWL